MLVYVYMDVLSECLPMSSMKRKGNDDRWNYCLVPPNAPVTVSVLKNPPTSVCPVP